MNIVFDCERMKYPHTGLYHFCHHLGNAIKAASLENGHALSFFTPSSLNGAFGSEVSYITQKKWHKFFMPNLSDFDLWHGTFQGTQYYPTSSKIKKVLTVHDLNFLYDERRYDFKRASALKKLQQKIDRSDAVVAISEFVMRDLHEHLNMSNTNAQVIYNGCNFNQSVEIKAPANQPNAPFLFTIGTITYKKNFHVLPALLSSYDGMLVISGVTQSQTYKQRILDEAKKHGVEDRVLFTGPITEGEKKWYMQQCEVFLFPSLAEGFGLPVVEAMYYGKPIILSDRTSLPEIGGDLAYYFHGFDPEHMRDVLKACIVGNSQGRLVELIKKRASVFSWEKGSLEYLKLFNSLI